MYVKQHENAGVIVMVKNNGFQAFAYKNTLNYQTIINIFLSTSYYKNNIII